MICRSCGREVPDGIFCTHCGFDQRRVPAPGPGSAKRRERFAAHPEEPVLQAGVLTTLLPHLDHDRVDEFRWSLIGGLGVVLLLYVVGLITAAIFVAAFLVPILYVLYLYEVRTYRDAPASVLGLTLGAGFALGAAMTVLGNLVRGPVSPVDVSPFGVQVDLTALLLTGLAIPIIQEAIKPLPALLLRRRPQFTESIDGLVFGVAAGLGFALAQTIVQFAGLFTTLDVRTDPANWIYPLATLGLLLPVLHGSSTGLVTAALWRIGRRSIGRREVLALVVAIGGHVAFGLGSQVVVAAGLGLPIVFVWQALVVGGLLMYVRYVLHTALLEEAASFGWQRTRCPNCGETVTAGGFCPSCGMALSAATERLHRPSDDGRRDAAEPAR